MEPWILVASPEREKYIQSPTGADIEVSKAQKAITLCPPDVFMSGRLSTACLKKVIWV
jgi:hypothetical protein